MQLSEKNWSNLLGLLVLLSIFDDVICGRAFPVAAVRWVEKHFLEINRNLEWDPTNFLTDLSGKYAKCSKRHDKGFFEVEHRTPNGDGIGGLLDHVRGDEPYVKSVTQYIQRRLKHWTKEEPYLSQIVRGKRFGCSVKPMCGGHAVMACLFSQPYHGDLDQRDNGRYHERRTPPPCVYPTHPPTRRRTLPPWTPPRTRPPRRPSPTRPPWRPPPTFPPINDLGPKARAFTKPQYRLAERITKQRWDKSYLLEALSGRETDCSMVHMRKWTFPFAGTHAERRGFVVEGLYGHHANHGATQPAMEKIMSKWPRMSAKKVGCSVIPDCPGIGKHRMMVVVSCLFKM